MTKETIIEQARLIEALLDSEAMNATFLGFGEGRTLFFELSTHQKTMPVLEKLYKWPNVESAWLSFDFNSNGGRWQEAAAFAPIGSCRAPAPRSMTVGSIQCSYPNKFAPVRNFPSQ